MIDERFRVPLSPPKSPRMSDPAQRAEYQSQHASKAHAHPGYRSYREHSDASVGYHNDVSPYSHDSSKSSSRSYKTFTYSPGPSSGSCHQYNSESFRQNAGGYQQQKPSHGLQTMASTEFHPTTYGASAPASPDNRLTPHSPDTSVKDQHDDDDLIDSAGEDQDEESEKVQMTAAELRAHKRKMKRFRLTHSQTRFLMSEFARQAHPDAGHRERLSREIPGLSARQVQVWFQNRRAKLKRHTTDDQARMMRSRALPDDFDTTQALHAPFGAQQPYVSAPVTSIGTYTAYGEPGGVRPLSGVSEFDQYSQPYVSPTGVSPALGAFAFTPPHSASDHVAPGSTSSMSSYVLQHQSTYEGSRRGPIGMPATDHGYAQLHHLPRMPHHERLSRTSGESTSSPLRTSVSHSGLSSVSGQPYSLPERSSSLSDQIPYRHQRPEPPRSVGVTEPDSYGMAFSYNPPHDYPSNEQQQQHSASAHHATDSDQCRRAPPQLNYSQYPNSSFTSAPYQPYQPPYTSREVHNGYHQQGQSEPSLHVQRVHSQSQGMPGMPIPLPFMHNQATDISSGARTLPPSY